MNRKKAFFILCSPARKLDKKKKALKIIYLFFLIFQTNNTTVIKVNGTNAING